MTNFLQKRKSVREFKKTIAPISEIEKIKDYISNIEEVEDVKFMFYENGKLIYEGLDGKAGYSGVMIKAPHYIAVKTIGENELNLIDTGYYLEKLNTFLVESGFDTCWITVDEVEISTMKGLFGGDGDKISYLIGFGYGVGKKLFKPETVSSRKDLNEIVFKDNLNNPISIEELENYGLLDILSSVRYAPSHMNFQPWRFVVKEGEIEIYMDKSSKDSRSLVDMGIVMYYFEEMAKTIGINKKWNIELKDGDFLYIGNFKM